LWYTKGLRHLRHPSYLRSSVFLHLSALEDSGFGGKHRGRGTRKWHGGGIALWDGTVKALLLAFWTLLPTRAAAREAAALCSKALIACKCSKCFSSSRHLTLASHYGGLQYRCISHWWLVCKGLDPFHLQCIVYLLLVKVMRCTLQQSIGGLYRDSVMRVSSCQLEGRWVLQKTAMNSSSIISSKSTRSSSIQFTKRMFLMPLLDNFVSRNVLVVGVLFAGPFPINTSLWSGITCAHIRMFGVGLVFDNGNDSGIKFREDRRHGASL